MKSSATSPEPPLVGADELPTGEAREANVQLLAGLGLGVYAAGSLALASAVCPVCVVAAPLLVGAGLFNRRRAAKKGSDGPGREP